MSNYVNESLGSCLTFSVCGCWGKGETLFAEKSVRQKVLGVPHNSKSVCGINSAKQAGKKEGGLGEGIFDRLLRAEGAMGWERLLSLATAREAKQNIFTWPILILPILFLLKRVEKCFALNRRFAAGGAAGVGHESTFGFASKNVRTSFKKHR